MSAEFSFGVDRQCALNVPYPARTDEHQTNHGFVDLRGRPDAARKIPEARDSPALQDLLAMMADDSEYMTLGCDTGGEQDRPDQAHSGGYIHYCYTDLQVAESEELHWIRAKQLSDWMSSKIEDENWQIYLECKLVSLDEIGGPTLCWSNMLYYKAEAPTLAEARASSEELTRIIGEHFRQTNNWKDLTIRPVYTNTARLAAKRLAQRQKVIIVALAVLLVLALLRGFR